LRSKTFTSLLIILLLSGSVPVARSANKEQYAFRSIYVFENRGEEAYALTEEDATMVLFLSNRWQTVTLRNASHGILREDVDEDGNSLAIMDMLEDIPAGSSVVFSIEYVVESEGKPQPRIDPLEAGSLSDIPSKLVDDYCLETETFNSTEDMELLAQSLATGQTTVLSVVIDMIDWIVENVKYSNFEVPMYPGETLEDLAGDCDDQAILLISMLRSIGVPALLQIGVVFSDKINSEKTSWGGHLAIQQLGVGWHGWAMVYVPPWGWLPVDLTLSGEDDPMKVILNAPQYEDYVVTAFNVSSQPYIGNSRSSRELLMSSDIYVAVTDKAIESTSDKGWLRMLYIGAGVLAGGTFVAVIILLNKRRRSLKDIL
jgi:hypothetical protein